MKWKAICSSDILGPNGDVEWKRVVKALEKATKQFNDFRTLWERKAVIDLNQQWYTGSDLKFELDLGRIKHIIPIAIVDFKDENYNAPSSRIAIPPIVLNVPDSIDKHGCVHSFLLHDFERIINDLFTVGDLITYLKLRAKQVATAGKFIHYSEMDLFAIFLVRYDIWDELLNSGTVAIERGVYERVHESNRSQFEDRRRLFLQEDFVDRILCGAVNAFMRAHPQDKLSANTITPCIEFSGRINCMTSLIKKLVSDKIKYNVDHWVPPKNINEEFKALSSLGRFAEIVLPTTVFLIAVAGFTYKTIGVAIDDLYYRLLFRLRNASKEKDVSEVLIILINGYDGQIFPFLRYVYTKEYDDAEEYMRQMPTNRQLSVEPILESEWTYAKRNSKSNVPLTQ